MPYKTEVTITAKTQNVDKTAKQLENIDTTIDDINKKKVNVQTGLSGLEDMNLNELKDLLRKAENLGLGKFKPQIMEEIANRQQATITPEITKEISTALGDGVKGLLSGINFKAIAGGLLGLRSAYYFIKQIASRNENLTASVQYLMDAIATFLEPILDFIAGMIASVAKHLGSITKGVKTTAKAAAKQLASFDEINNLTTKDSGSGRKKTAGEDFVDGLLELLKGLLEFIGGIIATIYYGPIMLLQTGIATIAAAIGMVAGVITGIIAGIVSAVQGFFQGFVEGFRKAREDGKSILSSIMSALWNGLKTGLNNFVTAFKNGFNTVWNWVSTKVITPIMTSVNNIWTKAVKPALQMIVNGLGRIVNGFVGMVNSVITVVNKLPGVKLGYLNRWSVPTLATGGMVNKGQLFVANENGAEMIGNFGNKTAVANNEQIIEGIKRGVEEAMQGSNQTIQLVVDGKLLTSVVVNNIRQQNRIMGRSVI